jgi:hypothetical protein
MTPPANATTTIDCRSPRHPVPEPPAPPLPLLNPSLESALLLQLQRAAPVSFDPEARESLPALLPEHPRHCVSHILVAPPGCSPLRLVQPWCHRTAEPSAQLGTTRRHPTRYKFSRVCSIGVFCEILPI